MLRETHSTASIINRKINEGAFEKWLQKLQSEQPLRSQKRGALSAEYRYATGLLSIDTQRLTETGVRVDFAVKINKMSASRRPIRFRKKWPL